MYDKLWNIKCCLFRCTPMRHIHIWIPPGEKHTLGDPGNQTTGCNSSLHSDKGWILHHLLRVWAQMPWGRMFWLLAGIMYKISAFRARWADSLPAPIQSVHFRPENEISDQGKSGFSFQASFSREGSQVDPIRSRNALLLLTRDRSVYYRQATRDRRICYACCNRSRRPRQLFLPSKHAQNASESFQNGAEKLTARSTINLTSAHA